MKTIAGYTPPQQSYPPYLSVCEDGEEIVIIVRSPATRDLNGALMQGATSSIRLPRQTFDDLFKALFQ